MVALQLPEDRRHLAARQDVPEDGAAAWLE